MRTTRIFLAASVLAALALPAAAQTAISGLSTDDCATVLDNTAEMAELYSFKIPPNGDCTDILWNTTNTGGTSAGLATTGDSLSNSWSVPPNWRAPQGGTDMHFVIVVYPATGPGQGNRVLIDTGTSVNQDFGAATRQTIGDSIGSYGGATPSVGITLAGSSATYGVKLRGTSSTAVQFPQGANGGIEVAFAPLAEINTFDPSGTGQCSIAGDTANPSFVTTPPAPPSPALGGGAILGYNVYRLAGTAGTVPTRQQFYDASINANAADGFQYFIPLTSSYNLGAMDTNPSMANTATAPSDLNPNDLGGLQNPDGIIYSGDEVIVYQDSATNRGVGRTMGTAPDMTGATSYWYAFQPVLCGMVSQFVTIGFANGSNTFPGAHTVDTNGDGTADGVNLDQDAGSKLEFFSPQANSAQPGLGLTYNGLPALSAPVFGTANPAAAHGQVTLSGHVEGGSVALSFQTGLEAGNVQGFNVFRLGGLVPTKVNSALILPQGTESSVYQLVDDLGQARRLARSGAVQYQVQIVYSDGTAPKTVGPFDVTIGSAAPVRRHR